NMTNLDRLIINELLDHGVVHNDAVGSRDPTKAVLPSLSLKRPSVQQRIGNYFKNYCSVLHRTIF
ncbi:hypothetical protein Lpp7_15640, partial [Lacticaseibacillus paracasei subsp. paracasei Lpp7]